MRLSFDLWRPLRADAIDFVNAGDRSPRERFFAYGTSMIDEEPLSICSILNGKSQR